MRLIDTEVIYKTNTFLIVSFCNVKKYGCNQIKFWFIYIWKNGWYIFWFILQDLSDIFYCRNTSAYCFAHFISGKCTHSHTAPYLCTVTEEKAIVAHYTKFRNKIVLIKKIKRIILIEKWAQNRHINKQ